MKLHANTLADEGNAFVLQAHLLFESGFAGQANLPTCPENAVPRQPADRAQRPNHLSSCAGESGSCGDLAVGRYLAFGDLQYHGMDLLEHAFSINDGFFVVG
jgi:hypothetical protein